MSTDALLAAIVADPDAPWQVLADALRDRGGEGVVEVHVVSGCSGEHSDFRHWDVAAFLDPRAAEDFCEALRRWCRENGLDGDDNYRGRVKGCPLDPNFSHVWGSGVSYGVHRLPLKG